MATSKKRPVWNDALKCFVEKLEYNFLKSEGKLYLPSGSCCDMSGCTSLFEKIDPKVKAIYTFSGERVDTMYFKEDDKWQAFNHEPQLVDGAMRSSSP